MHSILHRVTIDAPPKTVLPLLATKRGLAAWWTGYPLEGAEHVGGKLSFYFKAGAPAAVMEVVKSDATAIVWRCLEGSDEWRDTDISFSLQPRAGGGTTLIFRHDGWQSGTEFMGGCTTNWGAYLASLKSGAQGKPFAPYPAGEISRWS